MSRDPHVRIQRKLAGARDAVASCARESDQLEPDLLVDAVLAITAAEERVAQILGQAPPARVRRERSA